MFQFSGSPHLQLFIHYRLTEYCSAGFPHSEICGSMLICSYPQLIAACHVLLRLLMPRHSPCALLRLTSSKQTPFRSPSMLPMQAFALFVASPLSHKSIAFMGALKSKCLLLLSRFSLEQSLVLLAIIL